MADIFISYSKTDRDLTAKLSALLEAEGWTVWWDKNLKPADTYRKEIMKELVRARAVITIWTETSIYSDWVCAEAGRAKADGKLIPLKTSTLSYNDIPPPFGEMHTENVSAVELIRAAVAAQLDKPALTPSTFTTTYKTLRYQFLTWGGIIGGALTLFTNLGGGGVIGLAKWARWLVEHWHEWTHAFWTKSLGWIGLRIPSGSVPALTFLFFVMSLSIGIWLRAAAVRSEQNLDEHHLRRPFQKLLIAGAILAAMYGLWYVDYNYANGYLVRSVATLIVMLLIPIVGESNIESWVLVVSGVLFFLWFALPPATFVVLASKKRARVIFSFVLINILYTLVVISPALGEKGDFSIPVQGLTTFSLIAVTVLTPINSLIKRLSSLVVGLVILIGLNEISRHDWSWVCKTLDIEQICKGP